MWKSEKIELTKNEYHHQGLYFEGWYSLKINDEYITNTIKDPKAFNLQWDINYFQNFVCDFCGEEGCRAGSMLMARWRGDALLFLPSFEWLGEWEEYSSENSEGCSNCPPHRWFTDGILVVEGEQLIKLMELVSCITKINIREVNEEEKQQIERWEALVKEQPKGFMNREYLEN